MAKRLGKRTKLAGAIAMLLLAAGLLGYGGVAYWKRWHVAHEPYHAITRETITTSTDTPSETRPHEACASYKVGAQYPQRIALPALKASGCIERVGIDQHGAIAVPDNIYVAGWYVNSSLPGQPGLSVIDGHLSGIYNKDGIFQHLGNLKNGDTVTIILGNGKVLTYRVYKNQSVPVAKAAALLLRKDATVKSQLNLITCTGHYDKAAKSYDQRIIVSAALVGEPGTARQ